MATRPSKMQQQIVDQLLKVLDEFEAGEADITAMITSHEQPYSRGSVEKVVKFEIRWPVQFTRDEVR